MADEIAQGQRLEGAEALRVARDPNGPPAFMVYVCPRCALVHMDVVQGAQKVVGVGMTAEEADAASFEARAVAASAFAGIQALSAPRVAAGSLVLIAHAPGQPATVAVGSTARSSFTAHLAPADVAALAENLSNAAGASRARVAAADDAFQHALSDSCVAEMARQVSRFSRHGVMAKGCGCGHVHLWPIREGSPEPRMNFTPEQAEGIAADLASCARDARQAAREHAEAAAAGQPAPEAAAVDPSKLN